MNYNYILKQAKKDGIQRLNIAAVIQNQKGKVLICQRSYEKKFLPGIWHMPGGKFEVGETVEQALERELREELDLKITNIVKDTHISHDYVGHANERSRTVFIVVEVRGDIILNHENRDYTYISSAEVNTYFEPLVQEINGQIIKDREESGVF